MTSFEESLAQWNALPPHAPEREEILSKIQSTYPAEWARHESAIRSTAQFDARLVETLHALPLPAGVEQRIAGRLRDEKLGKFTTEQTGQTDGHSSLSRRMWWVGLAAAVLLVCAGVSWRFLTNPQMLTQQSLWEHAAGWSDQLDEQEWRTDALPRDLTIPPEVLFHASAWQPLRIEPFKTKEAVVCRLNTGRDGNQPAVLLYILPVNARDLPLFPPGDPRVTQGRLIAAWGNNQATYVLVMKDESVENLREYYDRAVDTDIRAV